MADIMKQEGDESTCSSGSKERAKGTRRLPEVVLLGVALVIGNQAEYSKYALNLGTMEFVVPSLVCCSGFFCLTLCLAEMTSALPFSGGLYGITRVTLGPFIGFLVACCEMLQSVAFTSTLLYPIGQAGIAIFGLTDNWAPLFWIIMLAISLTINILGVKYFWGANTVMVIIAFLLFIVYYAVSMPRIDCSSYGGGILQGRTLFRDWPSNLPTGTIMFAGLELLPMACSDAVQVDKFVIVCVILSLSSDLTLGMYYSQERPFHDLFYGRCSDPGGFLIAISPESVIFHGFVKGLHATQQVGNALTIPILFTTSCAFTYVYGIQLRSMADSGLFPTVLHYSYGEDRIPYVALLFGAVLVLGIMLQVSLKWYSYYPLYSYVDDCHPCIENLLNHWDYWFFGYLGFVTLWYFWQVRSSQKFSPQEQEIMFQAYVINANSATRNRRRLARYTSSQVSRGSSSCPSREKGRDSNSSGGTLLSRINHLIALPPPLDLQNSTFSLNISTSKMLLRRHSQVGASNARPLNELNEHETMPCEGTEGGKGGDEISLFQPDNTIASALVTQDPKPSLLSISSEFIQTIVKNRPEHWSRERCYIDLSPRHHNAVLPLDDSSSIASPKLLDEGTEMRSSRSQKGSSFALIHPSYGKSLSLDQEKDESGQKTNRDECREFNEYEGRVKSERGHLHRIQRQLSECMRRSRELFRDKAFDEKVEELLLKKSLSLNSSLESDADGNNEEDGFDRGFGEESRSLLSSRDNDS
eukprot:scaffold5245_cov183-Ochromonas_danica.AAC.12